MYALSFDMVISNLQKHYGEPYNINVNYTTPQKHTGSYN